MTELEKFKYSIDPISVSEIAKRIYAIADNDNMEKVSYRQINQWLLNIGMLYLYDFGGRKPLKRPTEEGNKIGIIVENRMGRYGNYQVVLYNKEAQHFILDNLDAVIATDVKKGKANEEASFGTEESDD